MPWTQLKAISDTHKAWWRSYYALPPDACPNDGTPLEVGLQTETSGGKNMLRHCPMGDYIWRGGTRET